jgi:hypothetical protein
MHLLALRSPPFHAALPPGLHPAVACGLLATVLDLALAIVWWAFEGMPPQRVLQSIAEWVLGARAYGMGMASAVFGAALYATLICAIAAAYRGLAQRFPALSRRPLLYGSAYGLAMYFLVFGALVPALLQRPAFGGPAWMVACMLAYMFLIGVPCALFARIPAQRGRRIARAG